MMNLSVRASWAAVLASGLTLGLVGVPACGSDDDSNGALPNGDGGADALADGASSGGDAAAIDPACLDGVKGGDEVDVDCGGSKCARCGVGKACTADGDCASGACEGSVCAQTAVCYPSGFCYENPTPTASVQYRRVRGTSPNDVWSVGDPGATLRWNGKRWLVFPSGTDQSLFALTFADATHGWAVGVGGVIVAWDGTKWSLQATVDTTQLRDVFAVSPTDVWAVGEQGRVYRFDGTNWTKQTVPGLGTRRIQAVWAAGKDDVWIGGVNGTIQKWNGSGWSAQTITDEDDTPDIESLFGASATTVWAGTRSKILTLAGSTWSPQADNLGAVNAGWTVDATHAYAVGDGVFRSWNGSSWNPDTTANAQDFWGVWASSPSDIWVTGARGELEHYDGVAWKSYQNKIVAELRAVAASDASNVVAVGTEGTFLRRASGTWVKETVPDGNTLEAVWTSGPTNTLAVGTNGIHRWDGVAWKPEPVASSTDPWHAVSGVDVTTTWVAGDDGRIARWDGLMWTLQPSGTSARLKGLHALDATNAWAVGEGGTIVRWNGVAWAPETSGTSAELRAVWAATANDVWAVGSEETLLRRVNGAWTLQPDLGVSSDYRTIAGSSPSDIWLVGTNGTRLRHFDGNQWEPFQQPSLNYAGLAVVGKTVWAVGTEGTIVMKP